ncbi:MAG: deacetylase [Clostridiales bacterium]|nr:deacetylase [Clostridiales bacterium]
MKKFLNIFSIVMLISVILIEIMSINAYKPVFAYSGKEKPIYCVETDEKKVAISFDAAWGADNTKSILDILDSYEVHATFFLVGFWVDKYPEMVKEIDSRGYEIGNHSENHPHMSELSIKQMENEIKSVNNKIYKLIGKEPTVFRAPYGDYSDTVIKTMRNLNMHTVQWSIDSLDWKEYGKQELINRVLKKVKSGDIILFHNNAKYTPDALPEILKELQNRGFAVCSVGELIHHNDYIVDIQGVQHKVSQ